MLWSPCKVLPFSSKILISVGSLKKKDKQDYKKSFNLIHNTYTAQYMTNLSDFYVKIHIMNKILKGKPPH